MLSQNFLTDRNFILKEVGYAELKPEDTVLEIGTGSGNLTGELVKKCAVVGIEFDPVLAEVCKSKFKDNFTLLQGDALKIDFPHFTKIVSNIPYHISAPLTFKILGHGFELAVLVYQKEFADKMAAGVGDSNYGRLSVTVQTKAEVELLDVVPKSAFSPVPKVDSRIVRLKPKRQKVPPLFDATVRALFQHRQQSVRNALKHSAHEIGFIPKTTLPDKKVFELSIPEIITLSEQLWNEKESGGESTQSSR